MPTIYLQYWAIPSDLTYTLTMLLCLLPLILNSAARVFQRHQLGLIPVASSEPILSLQLASSASNFEFIQRAI